MADSTVVRVRRICDIYDFFTYLLYFWEDKIPGLSQTDCLTGKGSEGDRGPCAPCQYARQAYVSNWVSAVQADANKICDCYYYYYYYYYYYHQHKAAGRKTMLDIQNCGRIIIILS